MELRNDTALTQLQIKTFPSLSTDEHQGMHEVGQDLLAHVPEARPRDVVDGVAGELCSVVFDVVIRCARHVVRGHCARSLC